LKNGVVFLVVQIFSLPTTYHNSEYPTMIYQHLTSHQVSPRQLSVPAFELEISGHTHSSLQALGIRVAYSPVSASEWRAARCISTTQSSQRICTVGMTHVETTAASLHHVCPVCMQAGTASYSSKFMIDALNSALPLIQAFSTQRFSLTFCLASSDSQISHMWLFLGSKSFLSERVVQIRGWKLTAEEEANHDAADTSFGC
jgi:hypothetical protein